MLYTPVFRDSVSESTTTFDLKGLTEHSIDVPEGQPAVWSYAEVIAFLKNFNMAFMVLTVVM